MKRYLRIAFVLLLGLAQGLLPAIGQADSSSASRLVQEMQKRRAATVRVIARLRIPFTPEGQLSARQAWLQRCLIAEAQGALLDRLGAPPGALPGSAVRARLPPHKKFRTIPYLALEVSLPELLRLYGDPMVVDISEDAPGSFTLTRSVPLVGGARTAGAGFTGAGQTVAVLDTGVDADAPALQGKVLEEACFSGWSGTESFCPNGQSFEDGPGSAAPCTHPDCGHGTHVAGIAVGNGGGGVLGMAPAASLIAIQVASRSSGGVSTLPSDYIRGLERILDLQGAFSIAAVNLSLGGGKFSDSSACEAVVAYAAVRDAVANLRSVGIATVAAAGNDGYSNDLRAPACLSNVVSVGATVFNGLTNEGLSSEGSDAVDTDYSNGAAGLTLLAPGTDIISSVPGGGTAAYTGTSMATPHVAGALALLRQQDPGASVDELEEALQTTGLPRTDPRSGTVTPRLQIDSALGLPGIEYRIHVAGQGWLDWQANGRIAGTTGKNKRAEAIQIRLRNAPPGARVRYRAHVQKKLFGGGGGWQDWMEDGATAGTVGENRRLEAVQVVLVSPPAGFGIQYRSHVAQDGWLAWVWDGETAGTTGQNRRAEAFQIRLGTPPPTPPAPAFGVRYQVHVRKKGWLDWAQNGAAAGTVDENRRMEAVRIELLGAPAGVGIRYQAHVSGQGWQGWVTGGSVAGTVGKNQAMEAIRIELTNPPPGANVRYRVHVRGQGWLDWVSDGAVAGTTGQNRRMEAIQVLIE